MIKLRRNGWEDSVWIRKNPQRRCVEFPAGFHLISQKALCNYINISYFSCESKHKNRYVLKVAEVLNIQNGFIP